MKKCKFVSLVKKVKRQKNPYHEACGKHFQQFLHFSHWQIQGRGSVGPVPPYFETKMMPEGPKKHFFEAAPPPYLRVCMPVPTPPPPTLSDNSVNMSARVFEVKNTISIFNTKILLDDVLNLKYKFIFIFLAHWFCKNVKTRV